MFLDKPIFFFFKNLSSKYNQNNIQKASICVISTKKLVKELNFRNEEDLYIIISFANCLKSDFSMSFQLKT
jgi:hypothetical protein